MSRRKDRVKARREARKARQQKRIANRDKRKNKRMDNREKRKERRIEGRDRLHSRIYGKLHPHVNDAIDDIQPLQDAMNDDLADKGVDVQNPDDTIEVASKYAENNPEINDSVDANALENAYGDEEGDNMNDEDTENFDWSNIKNSAKKALKAGFGSVGSDISDHIDALAQKKAAGQPLTANEEKLLNASTQAHEVVKEKVVGDITDTLKKFAPVLIAIIILGVVIKKLG